MSPTPPEHHQQHQSHQLNALTLSPEQRDGASGRNASALVDASAAVAAADALHMHRRNAQVNAAVDVDTESNVARTSGSTASVSPVAFHSYTVAPSPPASVAQDSAHDSSSELTRSPDQIAYAREAALHLQTELPPALSQIPHPAYGFSTPAKSAKRPALSLRNQSSAQSLRPVSRTPSLKTSSIYGALGSASATSSTVASPVISAMGDVTPLPSPLLAGDSPGPWKQLASIESASAATPLKATKKTYAGMGSHPAPVDGTGPDHDGLLSQPRHHARNRSISEYIPDPMLIPKRMSTVSGTHVKADLKSAAEAHMRREPHLSEARGLTPIEKPPTPPPSESSLSAVDSVAVPGSGSGASSKQSAVQYFEAHGRYDKKLRRWRAVRVLGQGTFSQVYLATSQTSSPPSDDEGCSPGARTQTPEPQDRRSLVAVKVCEHGPRGGASEDRIEMSLKRELEIMQSIRHPSLVNLKAWNIEPSRAILVLSYCPGGDLFDIATRHRDVLKPALIRRMFSELVGALIHLHDQKIVHRDIKLENVLVNLPPSELASSKTDWATYPYSVITLTDLGLSRRIADDEKLETRCGSDDYAAPEVIMGQPYDGRATDAWSLGVLLYAILEARLPFDPPPCGGPTGPEHHARQPRMRSRTSHRIARVEWRWYLYGAREGEDGEGEHEADVAKFEAKGLTGAMDVVEGLLKRARSRWPLARVAETEWVAAGVRVPGGIKFREEEEGEEVLP